VRGSGNRVFHYALAASLVLHALVLAYPTTVKSGHRPASASRQIVARLVEVPERKVGKPRPATPRPAIEATQAQSPDQYRMQLIDEARRHKRYPPFARENNWRGEVLVALTLGAGGRASVSLKASSGYEALDRQALEMLEQAARSVPLPPALRGTQFALEVRAVYGPED
jgi:TonB family protein